MTAAAKHTRSWQLHQRGTLRVLADLAAIDRLQNEPRETAQARLEAALGPDLVRQLERRLGIRLTSAAQDRREVRLRAA